MPTSWMAQIVPYMDLNSINENLNHDATPRSYTNFSDVRSLLALEINRTAYTAAISHFVCPSDPESLSILPSYNDASTWNQSGGKVTHPNYYAVMGTPYIRPFVYEGMMVHWQASNSNNPPRPAGVPGMFDFYTTPVKVGEIADGTSKTMFAIEKWAIQRVGVNHARGAYWFSGQPIANPVPPYSGTGHPGGNWRFLGPVTVVTCGINPGSNDFTIPRSCAFGAGDYAGFAASYHGGGANALFVDGSVQFLSESIDTVSEIDYLAPSPQVIRRSVLQQLITRKQNDNLDRSPF